MQYSSARLFKLWAAVVLVLSTGLGRLAWSGPASRVSVSPADAEISALQAQFRNPPDDSKVMVRWWWFGPAVTTEELNHEMREMKDAGIGGFEVQPVYPLTPDDPSKGLVNLRYLSPEFLAAVGSTARSAHELGLRMDMTMGSGWPYGGPHITPDLAAGRLLLLRVPIRAGALSVPALHWAANQHFLAAFVAVGDGRHFDLRTVRQVFPQGSGLIELPKAFVGSRVLLVFAAGLTGQQVKRAAVGAEGNVLDHYRRAALQKHLDSVGEPLAEAGAGNIRAMFCDSLEVYGSDWTAGFLGEFERRRGYDLTPHLPALVADAGPQTAALRHDWAQTLTELFDENFLKPFQAWCRQHQVLARVQAYGIPPAQLSSYRYVDLPEGEQGDQRGNWNDFTASRWASSAGHHYGKRVVSAEAWTWIHGLSFRATPLDFKAYADQYFLEGINQLVGHGWPYSPPGVPEPGWHFYAAGAINPHNPWWFAMPDLALYLQRASFMLRQGSPANDILVYLPTHDAWASMTPGHTNLWDATWRQLGPDVVPSLLEAGYNLDFVDDQILAQQGRIEEGRLKIADQEFSVVVMPGITRIPILTLAKFREFAQSGGVLVATRHLPTLAPGFLHHQTESQEVMQQVHDLFVKPSALGHFIPDEKLALEDGLVRIYPRDVAFSPRTRDIGFIHRHTNTEEIYFLANASNHRVETTATFRVKGMNAEWWDLFSGEMTGVTLISDGDAPVVKLDIEPYGSRLLVFSHRSGPTPQPPQRLPEPLDLSHGWQLAFEGSGQQTLLDALRSWTELDGRKFYSGRATYRRSFNVPAGFLAAGLGAYLNLGEPTPIPVRKGAHFQAWLDGPVREAAEVFVNARRVGTIWHPPYELDVTSYLHSGKNELRICVGNLAVNEMAGRPLPDRKKLTARYGERFVDQGNDLLQAEPSGLLGPIRLTARGLPAVIRSGP